MKSRPGVTANAIIGEFDTCGYFRWGAAIQSESRHRTGYKVSSLSEPNFFWRSPLRHVVVGKFLFIPFLADIKIAIATAVFLHVRLAIDARTDYVLIPFPVTTRQPAGTCHVTVAVLVDHKIF